MAHDARVFKSGNSLAVRIPSAIARHCELEDGVTLEIAAGDGLIYLRRVQAKTLDELIDDITPENVVPELFPGPFAGNERSS